MTPTVSVIVPNYNHAPYLRQRIESIFGQTYQDFELILLDDSSTDGSRSVLDNYRNDPHVTHHIYNEANSGSAFLQWKKGIELAQGEWIWIAESDDYAEPTFLEEMLSAASHHPSCSIVASTPLYLYPDGNTWHQSTKEPQLIPGTDFAQQHLINYNCLPNASALLLRRSSITTDVLYSITGMRLCGDWMLYAHCCHSGDILITEKVLSSFRQHGDNTSSTTEKKGLSLIEGVEVLNYIRHTFQVSSTMYARSWGRTWAKLERRHHYSKPIRSAIRKSMKGHPAIKAWHTIYRIKQAL